MIRNFKHKGLENFFYDGIKKGIQPDHTRKLEDILDRLDAAHDVKDMVFPGSGLHPLKGNLKDFWAVTVSANWRIIFKFHENNAYDVNYMDYH